SPVRAPSAVRPSCSRPSRRTRMGWYCSISTTGSATSARGWRRCSSGCRSTSSSAGITRNCSGRTPVATAGLPRWRRAPGRSSRGATSGRSTNSRSLAPALGWRAPASRSAANSHEIVVVRPPEQTVVLGDHQRLEQVMVNLLQNAIKYSPQGGQIVVTVGREGGDAVVSVADQGIGVPAEEQAKLFQRFFRARNAATRHFGGLGIGLFVSHEIVQRHGGRFLVASESGKGAVFSFTLPLSPAHAAPDRGRAPAQA